MIIYRYTFRLQWCWYWLYVLGKLMWLILCTADQYNAAQCLLIVLTLIAFRGTGMLIVVLSNRAAAPNVHIFRTFKKGLNTSYTLICVCLCIFMYLYHLFTSRYLTWCHPFRIPGYFMHAFLNSPTPANNRQSNHSYNILFHEEQSTNCSTLCSFLPSPVKHALINPNSMLNTLPKVYYS